jgi:hypothetical protein
MKSNKKEKISIIKNSFSFPFREKIFLKEHVTGFDVSKSGNKIFE